MTEFRRLYWRQLFERHGQSVTRAARAGGIHRSALYRTLAKLNIRFVRHRGNWGDLPPCHVYNQENEHV